MMEIEGILIPSAYTHVEDVSVDIPHETVRFFAGADGATYGPFQFNPHDSKYQEFMSLCKERENALERELDIALCDLHLPFRSLSSINIKKLMKEGKRKIYTMLRPPHFKTAPQESRENCRHSPRYGITNFCLHIDERDSLHFMRRWEHPKADYALRKFKLDEFAQSTCLQVHDKGDAVQARLSNQDLKSVSEIVAEAIYRSFHATSATSQMCPDWYCIEPRS